MDIITATKILIVTTVGVLFYNLYQIMLSYGHMKHQVDEFLTVIKDEAVSAKSVTQVNGVIYLILPTLYIILLYLANFSYFIVTVVGLKLLIGSSVSFWIQSRIISQQGFSQSFYVINKVDHGLNAIFMLLILYFAFL